MTKETLLVFHPGLATYRVDFFNALAINFRASFYFSYKSDPDHLYDQHKLLSSCNFKPHYLTKGFHVFRKTFRLGLIKIILKNKPDLIICSEFGPVTITICLYKLFFRKKFKLYTISDDSLDNAKRRSKLRALFRNFFSKKIDGIIFPSNEVCSWYHNNVSQKIKTMVNPIIHDDRRFRGNLKSSLQMVNENIIKYNLKGKKVILFVGRLAQVKNVSLLVSAFSTLKQMDVRLIIIGDGALKKKLESQSKNLNLEDKIYFLGKKQEMELLSWYAIAHIFVLPSTYEPFGAVVNEALLSGNIVLCSQLAGASGLINDSNGKIFDPHNVLELKDKMQHFLSRISPIKNEIKELRDSKMGFTFNEKINTLIQKL